VIFGRFSKIQGVVPTSQVCQPPPNGSSPQSLKTPQIGSGTPVP